MSAVYRESGLGSQPNLAQAHLPSCSSDLVRPWSLYTSGQRWTYLALLFVMSTSNYFDRNVLSVLLEPIKREFRVSDTMLGLLSGLCFSVFYVLAGIPVARWADRGNRRTIVTLALATWSATTMFCGLAQRFWQLALARVGVGIGESGAIAPAQSLIADYFPPEQRAVALGAFDAAGTAGYLLGVAIGGFVAANYGWRNVFLLAGAPGLLVALVVRFCLPEPRMRVALASRTAGREGVAEALSILWRKHSYLYAVASSIVYWFFAYGVLIFIPSFLVRVLGVPLARASLLYGSVAAVASVVGAVGGGWLADQLGRRDVRWLAWFPALTYTLATPAFGFAFALNSFSSFLILAFVGMLLLTAGSPPVFAATHAICGSRRRATAIAILFFSATLAGGGLGPLATGALSDTLGRVYGNTGLGYALCAATALLPVSAILLHAMARRMPSDIEQ